jgi:hypothetical protein
MSRSLVIVLNGIVPLTEGFDRTVVQIVEQSDVVMSLLESLFIKADAGKQFVQFPVLAPRDGPHDNVPSLIRLRPQNAHRALDRLCGQQNINGQSFKEYCESTVFLGLGNIDILDPMLRTFHSRNTGGQDRLELTRIQMSPTTLFGMIVAGQRNLALGATKAGSGRVNNADPNLRIFNIQFHILHRPRCVQPKNMLVKFFVLYKRSPWRRILTNPRNYRMDLISAGAYFTFPIGLKRFWSMLLGKNKA